MKNYLARAGYIVSKTHSSPQPNTDNIVLYSIAYVVDYSKTVEPTVFNRYFAVK